MSLFRSWTCAACSALFLFSQTACEIEVDSASDSESKPAAPAVGNPIVTPPAGNPATPGTPGNNNNGNPGTNPSVPAPGVPSQLSPGSGESFSGSGAKATLAWTDAERAVQFEVVVQAYGSGGWQQAAHAVTDNFQYTYAFSNPSWTRYRWAVRSLGADNQASAFTGYREFSWTP